MNDALDLVLHPDEGVHVFRETFLSFAQNALGEVSSRDADLGPCLRGIRVEGAAPGRAHHRAVDWAAGEAMCWVEQNRLRDRLREPLPVTRPGSPVDIAARFGGVERLRSDV